MQAWHETMVDCAVRLLTCARFSAGYKAFVDDVLKLPVFKTEISKSLFQASIFILQAFHFSHCRMLYTRLFFVHYHHSR